MSSTPHYQINSLEDFQAAFLHATYTYYNSQKFLSYSNVLSNVKPILPRVVNEIVEAQKSGMSPQQICAWLGNTLAVVTTQGPGIDLFKSHKQYQALYLENMAPLIDKQHLDSAIASTEKSERPISKI